MWGIVQDVAELCNTFVCAMKSMPYGRLGRLAHTLYIGRAAGSAKTPYAMRVQGLGVMIFFRALWPSKGLAIYVQNWVSFFVQVQVALGLWFFFEKPFRPY